MPAENRPANQPSRADMPWGERIRRYLICFLGIFCISFGVALFTKSGTGTSAISVIPYTLSELFHQLSYGTWVCLFNMLLALSQAALLRRDTDWFDICQQLVFALIFGSIVDLSMWILTYLSPAVYWQCLIVMALSIPILALGAYLTLISRVGVMAGDGFARAVSRVTGKEFALVRVISDSTMALTAVVICLAVWGQLVTVREGTVVGALLTGTCVGWYSKHLKRFEYAILPKNKAQDTAAREQAQVPAENFVVTVSREYGSGGREVGRLIAERLGVPCYDAQIINDMAAEEGFSVKYVAANEQKVTSSARETFYRLYAGAVPDQDMSQVEQLYHAEQRVIKRLAAQGSCVIVGRLANYILRTHENRLDLFIRANMSDKIEHVMERDHLNRSAAQAKISKVDHDRAEHCRYFTHREWGDARNYDATMNTSRYGIQQTGQALAEMAAAARDASVQGGEPSKESA